MPSDSTPRSQRPAREEPAPSAPPLREDYGGPRESSDGIHVTPDASSPDHAPDAPPTPTSDGPGESIPPRPPSADVPPTPPTEPPPVPIHDPDLPDAPYIVDERGRATARTTEREPRRG